MTADEPTESSNATHEQIVELIQALVRIDSSNPPGREADCARFIRDWFVDHDIDAELVPEPYPDRPQVAAVVGSGNPAVVLNGHLDVVPVESPDEWQHPPFGGAVDGGRIYGRGSADMKAGLAIAMVTMAAFQRTHQPGEGTLVFHGAIGEETGEPGTRTLLERGFDGDYGIVLEPTDFRVATRAKGLVCYEITVSGSPSHASRPDQGENAIQLAQPLLDAIAAYNSRLRSRTDELVGTAYASVTRFAAGVDGNLGVIPGTATLVLDRRVLPGESIATVEAEVEALLDSVEATHGIELAFEEVQRYESASVPTNSPLAETLRQHIQDSHGGVEVPWGIEAATDVRNLVNDAGMDAVTWGPGHLSQAHTRDEYIELDDVRTGYQILNETIQDLFEAGDGSSTHEEDT